MGRRTTQARELLEELAREEQTLVRHRRTNPNLKSAKCAETNFPCDCDVIIIDNEGSRLYGKRIMLALLV